MYYRHVLIKIIQKLTALDPSYFPATNPETNIKKPLQMLNLQGFTFLCLWPHQNVPKAIDDFQPGLPNISRKFSGSLGQASRPTRYIKNKKGDTFVSPFPFLWAHLGSNQGPPDYESGALTI